MGFDQAQYLALILYKDRRDQVLPILNAWIKLKTIPLGYDQIRCIGCNDLLLPIEVHVMGIESHTHHPNS